MNVSGRFHTNAMKTTRAYIKLARMAWKSSFVEMVAKQSLYLAVGHLHSRCAYLCVSVKLSLIGAPLLSEAFLCVSPDWRDASPRDLVCCYYACMQFVGPVVKA